MELPLGSFLKLYREQNTRGIPENTEKELQTIPADSRPLHGVRGLQVTSFFPYITYIHSHIHTFTYMCEFKFDRKISSGAIDQAKVKQSAAFCDDGWGHFALYP